MTSFDDPARIRRSLHKPHRLVLLMLRNARAAQGGRSLLGHATERRKYFILDNLFKDAERRGHGLRTTEDSPNAALFIVGGVTVRLTFTEECKGGDISAEGPSILTVSICVPGEIAVVISDEEETPLEARHLQILTAIEATARSAAPVRGVNAIVENWPSIEDLSDDERWAMVRQLAARHQELASVKAFIGTLRGQLDQIRDNSVRDLVNWADDRLAKMDPLGQATNLSPPITRDSASD